MAEEGKFERTLAILESYKLLQDWSKWLITIEIAICTGLWTRLTAVPKPPAALYLSWFMFLGSIIIASILLIVVSFSVRRVALYGDTRIAALLVLLSLEYAFFFLGLVFLAVRLIEVWLAPQ